MSQSKPVKVWVVWQKWGGWWRAMWFHNTRQEARARAFSEYSGMRACFTWRITSGTVNPPGEGK
jgi:hypothetical protein